MTSERQRVANRRNSRNSSGPRTAAGKVQTSRNALRHGMAALTHRRAFPAGDVERFAKAISEDDDDPSLIEQATIIAQNELVLRSVYEQKLALIERLRERGTMALSKGDVSFILAKLRSLKTQLAYKSLLELCARIMEQYKDELPPPLAPDETGAETFVSGELIPLRIQALDGFARAREAVNRARKDRSKYFEQASKLIRERDQLECMEKALADLLRLDRYERRAWSRQKKAIRAFIEIKSTRKLCKDQPRRASLTSSM
jgi:hypothetical protein